jgi:hypothetical protein
MVAANVPYVHAARILGQVVEVFLSTHVDSTRQDVQAGAERVAVLLHG